MTINSINSNIPIEISKGGTNAASFSTANGIVKYDGTSLVSSTTATIDASNRMTNTAQPAFLAFLSVVDDDITGAGAWHILGAGNALEESFDQGNNFVTTGTFTAPITGKYLFGSFQLYSNLSAAMTAGRIQLVTTIRTYEGSNINAYEAAYSNNYISFSIVVLADMVAGDTAYVRSQISNGAADTVKCDGGVTKTSCFYGHLSC